MDSAEDNIPLHGEETSPSSSQSGKASNEPMLVETISESKAGYFLSKTKLILLLVVIAILVILIIVLGALLGAATKGGSAEVGGPSTAVRPTTPTGLVPTTAGSEPYWNVRLPKNIIPKDYDVLLRIDLKKFVFDGSVVINVNVTSDAKFVLVHTNKMNVSKATVNKQGDNEPLKFAKTPFWFEKNQFYVMEMQEALTKGQYVIKMEFEAFLTTELNGLYRSTYSHSGKNVSIATTQFQPTDARKAFPCFDEPGLKATFKVTLAHDPKMIALSNMPISKTYTKEGFRYDEFDRTVKMPTYLLAFVVCDFQSITATTASGVKNTYYAPYGKKDQLPYARKIGNMTMQYFEEYYNVSFPLPKSDMIAIPDFAAGAMENWGLITYRETALLYDPKASSESNKERVAMVIVHELAHQWFGNLVTMEWWNDLWLNEGFASYMEYVGTDHAEPSWKIKDHFVNNDLEYAFRLDGLATSHPVQVDVNHPNEINEIFDSISYNKGASILRMLDNFLGEDTFKAGLTRYLLKHKYANTKTDDLWSALTKQARLEGNPINVKEVMDTWTLQMNYPVITIKKPPAGQLKAPVTQERFLYDPAANITSKYTSPFEYKWVVPFTFCTPARICSSADPGKGITWLNKTDGEISWDGTGWIKGNVHHMSYYRVNYPSETWKELSKQLIKNHSVFSATDRAGLINDAFNLARGKLVNYTDAMELTKYLKNETEYVPWGAGRGGLAGLTAILPKSRPSYKYMQKYLMYLAKDQYKSLGFKDVGGHNEKYKRSVMIGIFCGASDPECLKNASDYFKKWKEDPKANPVPPNFRSLVYYYGIANGGEEEWDFMFKQFQETNIASERIKFLYGLCATKEPWLLSRYLLWSLDPSKIRSQDTSRVVSYVANYNPIGRQIAWDMLRLNWPTIKARYGSAFFTLGSMITRVIGGFSQEFQLQEVQAFVKSAGDLGTAKRAVTNAIERVKSTIEWRERNEADIENWLKKTVQELGIQ